VTQLVHEFVGSAVRRFGPRTALVDANGTLTYNAMWDRSRRAAAALRGLGVRPGDRVAAVMHNRSEWVEIDCAVSMVGGIRGRLNARDSLREFAWVLNDLRPSVVVTGPEFTSRVQQIVAAEDALNCPVIGLGDGGAYEKAIAGSQPFEPEPFSADEPYVIMHTSGTTGNYKGAVYLHRQWVNIYRNILATIMNDVGPDSALLHVGPLSHQSGILTAPALFHGARSVMMTHFDPVSFFEIVETERITHTILAPAIINALAHHPAAGTSNLTSLRQIYYSGSPIAPAVLSRAMDVFGPIFLQGYGSTEGGTIYNTIMYPDEHVEALQHAPERLAACGRPTPFFDVRLVGDDGQQVPAGEIGEVWVRGDSVSAGYWHQPEATAKAYPDGWFRMGDLATADADGYITIIDRKNDMIISGGLNVYPREVEDVIAAHPGVSEVAVIGVPDDKWGEAVHACISLRPGASVTLEQLHQHCRDSGLATYKKPLSLELVDEIPKTAVGKVFRRALRERYWTRQGRRVG
jgi:acyl-CoA synthetase (AMP-forming)/AMP-acid ligase II